MSIKILLDRAVVWHPGDIVSGTVVFASEEQMSINNINVDFEGRMETKETRSRGQNGSVTYLAQIGLFHEHKNLFKGPYTLPPTTKSWPFQFQLPYDCRMAKRLGTGIGGGTSAIGFNPAIGGDQQFDTNPEQPLPPSLNGSDCKFGGSYQECKVVYSVSAKLSRIGIFKSDIKTSASLQVEPYRAEQDRVPIVDLTSWTRDYLIKSYYLDPDMEDRPLTLKEKMKSTFNSKEIPQIRFKLHVKMPTSMMLGQDPPIFVGIQWLDHDGRERKQSPGVDLRSYKIILQLINHQMVAGGEGIFSNRDHHAKYSTEVIIEAWAGRVPLNGDLDLRELKGDKHLRTPLRERSSFKQLVPSFKSFIISRSYRMRVEGEVECAQKTESFSTNGSTREIVLLPPDCTNSQLLEPPNIDSISYIGDALPSDDLPTYRAATKA